MNALHVHSGNMFGGVERMMETLAPATAGCTPIHSSFALCFAGRVSDTLRSAGGEVHPLGPVRARRVDEVRRARRTLRELLGRTRWDVALVHSSWSQAIFGPAIIDSGVPMVRWLHAPEPGPAWMEYWASRAKPNRVLCNSEYTLAAAQPRLRGVPAAVCYPPAPATPRTSKVREVIRRQMGTPEDAVVIVIAARMEAWKGHHVLIESLPALGRHGWELWVVGAAQRPVEVRYFDALVSGAERAMAGAQVRFLGERSDVSDLLEAADLYCQPNTHPEPFGLSFVEALSAGLPVVTTRLGAAPEIVTAECGVLLAHATPQMIGEALNTLIRRPAERQRLAEGARLRSRQFCDLHRSLSRLAHEFAQIAPPSLALT